MFFCYEFLRPLFFLNILSFFCYRHTLFLVRSWRNWCVVKFNNIQNCVTTNAYWGLELNAHSLINYIVHCRIHGTDFDPTLLQSQTCEGTFRDARSLTSTRSTIVNFTIQGLESRLNRIQFKRDAIHRNAHVLKFPSLKNTLKETEKLAMPTNDEIIDVVERAQKSVREILIDLGVDSADISFDSSLTTKCPKAKPVNDIEFVTVPDEFEAYENENYDDIPEEFEVYGNENDDVHDASELFENIGEDVCLRDSKQLKNVFKIKNRRNKIVHVNKRTFLWMLTSGMQKCSTDRTYRFFENKDTRDDVKYSNEVFESIAVGEYVLLRMKQQLSVFKVYGFKYLNGKNRSCSSSTVPVKSPKDAEHRSIGLLGSSFEMVECDGEYMLDWTSNSQSIDVKHYVSHLVKPTPISAIFFYPEETVAYIKQFM